MKEISSKEGFKEVLYGQRVNKESVYYSALFGAASVTALVLLIIAYAQRNTDLKIYSYVLLPVFMLCTAIAVRYTIMCKDRIYVKDGTLTVKGFFVNRSFEIESIERLTTTSLGDGKPTRVKIVYGKESYRYSLWNFSNEDAVRLKKITSRR